MLKLSGLLVLLPALGTYRPPNVRLSKGNNFWIMYSVTCNNWLLPVKQADKLALASSSYQVLLASTPFIRMFDFSSFIFQVRRTPRGFLVAFENGRLPLYDASHIRMVMK